MGDTQQGDTKEGQGRRTRSTGGTHMKLCSCNGPLRCTRGALDTALAVTLNIIRLGPRIATLNHLGVTVFLEPKYERKLFCTMFLNTPGVRDIPANFPGHPGDKACFVWVSIRSKGKNELSKEGASFSSHTPSHGRPPPHWAVSRPKNVIFMLFV